MDLSLTNNIMDGAKGFLSVFSPSLLIQYFYPFLVESIFDNVTVVQAARVGFCSLIKNFSDIERGTSIAINRGVDLARVALQIAAEDDSLISHSSVPLPVDDFIERLDGLSMGYCSHYSSSIRSSPENFLDYLERYLYLNKVRLFFMHDIVTDSVELHSTLCPPQVAI